MPRRGLEPLPGGPPAGSGAISPPTWREEEAAAPRPHTAPAELLQELDEQTHVSLLTAGSSATSGRSRTWQSPLQQRPKSWGHGAEERRVLSWGVGGPTHDPLREAEFG